jgi:RNA polymerase sigma-70 factor (ECF subfamily)
MKTRGARVTGRTDASLLVDYARGDRGALDALVGRRWGGAYRVALRSLGDPGAAEDAAADAFAALVRSAPRFAPDRPFGPWFGAVLLNAIKKQERARRRREHHERRAAEARPVAVDGASDLDDARLEPHLRDLPLDLRLPLVLHFYEGRTHAEVADALGCPVGTASSRIRRGLERLRGSLAGAAGAGVPSVEALAAALGVARSAPELPAAPSIARLEALAGQATRSSPLATLATLTALTASVLVATLALGALLAPDVAEPVVASPGTTSGGDAGRVPRASDPAQDEDDDSRRGAPAGTSAEPPARPAPEPGPGPLAQPRRAVGRVVDRGGAPIPDARVTVSRNEYDRDPDGPSLDYFDRARRVAALPPERRVEAYRALRSRSAVRDVAVGVSDADGRFSLAVPSDLKHLHLSVAVTLRGRAHVGAVRLDDDSLDAGEVRVDPVRRIAVTVTSAGVPVVGADVYLSVPTSDRENDDFWAWATTDATGAAMLEDPFGFMGEQTVVVVAPGHAIETRGAPCVDGQETVVAVELVAGVDARLHVVDDAGRPVEGVVVEARAVVESAWFVVAEGRSDATGAVTLAGLTPGRAYALEATTTRPDLLDRRATVTGAAVLPALALHAPIPLVVRATADADDFEARDHVTLQRLEDGGWTSASSEQERVVHEGVDAGGVLTFREDDVPPDEVRHPRLQPGTYRVIVDLEGFATLVSAPLTLAPGASAQEVVVRLAPGRTARGRVVDRVGKPIAGASVDLCLGDHEVSLGTTAEDGTFETTRLPAGPLPDDAALIVSDGFMGPETRSPLAPDATWLGDLVGERNPYDEAGDEEEAEDDR